MFNKRSLFVPAALISFGLIGTSAAKADGDTQCYTLASLKGTYAVVATYGANVALALATRHFDGEGKLLTGTFTLNAPVVGFDNRRQDDNHRYAGGNLLGELQWHWRFHPHPYVIHWCRHDSDG